MREDGTGTLRRHRPGRHGRERRDDQLALTRTEVDRYHRDGFLVLDREVLPRDEVEQARAVVDGLVANWKDYPQKSFTGTILDADAESGIHGVRNPTCLDHDLLRLSLLRTCQEIASELLDGRRTWLYFDHVVSKESGDHTGGEWHQDFAYSSSGMTRASVHFWVPLQDVAPIHGGMTYVPGSHRTGLRDHQTIVRTGDTVRSAEVQEEGVVLPPIGMGGLVCHDPMTLHRSQPNLSGQVRRAWVIHFGAGPWSALRHADILVRRAAFGLRRHEPIRTSVAASPEQPAAH